MGSVGVGGLECVNGEGWFGGRSGTMPSGMHVFKYSANAVVQLRFL